MKQLEMLKERCELYKQREKNIKQISEYMDDLELSTKLRKTTEDLSLILRELLITTSLMFRRDCYYFICILVDELYT